MRFGRLPRTPRRVLMLFLAVTVLPGAALGWLSFSLIGQESDRESRELQAKLERAADGVVAVLDQRLVDARHDLADPVASSSVLPNDSLLVTFGPRGIQAYPNERLLYYPSASVPVDDVALDDVFAAGWALELRDDYVGAIAAFRELSQTKNPALRAGALIRLARNLKKNGQRQEALDVYKDLQRVDSVSIEGVPADLLARKARCATLAELGRDSDLQREAQVLRADLESGHWHLDRASYSLLLRELNRWLPDAPQSPSETTVAIAAVQWLWDEWQTRRDLPNEGRRSLWIQEKPVLVIWSGSQDNLTALIAGAVYVESRFAGTLNGLEIALSVDGREAVGRLSKGSPVAIKDAAVTHLPWTVHVISATPAADSADLSRRNARRVLFPLLAIVAVVTLIGGYWTARAAAREFAAARLQSDFVSAVSHEFRTPLTSLRHLTELLASGTVTNEDRRQQFYAVLAHESERLTRLVEGLLDFGRMEAGGRQGQVESVDPVELVENIVTDFQSDMNPPTHRVELTTNGLRPGVCMVEVNREAFSRAVRNLLENAVKYSPGRPAVQVALGYHDNRLAIRIHDDGFGIPIDEQKMIFEKFVRGAASKALHVQGTGIGLAMTQHIVRTHKGEILLESEPGRGTTFTIEVPLTGTT